MEEVKRHGRGGARPNAGRKKLEIAKVLMRYRVPEKTKAAMEEMAARRGQTVPEMLSEIFK